MTLARTALRLCVSAALKGETGARPTIAEGRVYDSRMSDYAPDAFSDDAKPTVILLSDVDDGDALSDQNGGPPFRRMIEIVIEMGMTQAVKDGDDYVVGYPDTDARHEASLDLLEFQILRRLAYDPAPMSVLFRKIARIRKRECHRQVLDESNVKVAARVLTLTCQVEDDKVQIHDPSIVPSGMEALPQPLRDVCLAMSPGAPGYGVCQAIADAVPSLTAEEFEGINFTIDAGDGDQGGSDIMDVSVEIRSALDVPQVVANGAAVTIDYAKGTFQNLILAADVTTMSVINWPRSGKTGRLILQITNTGSFKIHDWPPGTVWSDGAPPYITQGAGMRDVVVLTTAAGGEPIFGNVVGQNYS